MQNGTVSGLAAGKAALDTRAIANVVPAMSDPAVVLSAFESRFCLYDPTDGSTTLTGDWTEHAGIWYSKPDYVEWQQGYDYWASPQSAVVPAGDAHIVAVYGTLKQGEGNSGFLLESEFIEARHYRESHEAMRRWLALPDQRGV